MPINNTTMRKKEKEKMPIIRSISSSNVDYTWWLTFTIWKKNDQPFFWSSHFVFQVFNDLQSICRLIAFLSTSIRFTLFLYFNTLSLNRWTVMVFFLFWTLPSYFNFEWFWFHPSPSEMLERRNDTKHNIFPYLIAAY